jgi:hypothetical protein
MLVDRRRGRHAPDCSGRRGPRRLAIPEFVKPHSFIPFEAIDIVVYQLLQLAKKQAEMSTGIVAAWVKAED